MFNFDLQYFLFLVPWILPSLAFHEFGHAWAAYRLGDPTPERDGRLTLSPWAHIDPLGLLGIVLVGFGWGKPVEIRGQFFRNPLRDMMFVSLAGPVMNLFLAAIVTVFIRLYAAGALELSGVILRFLEYGVILNIRLMIFNLIPVPPLDGSKILQYFLRGNAAYQLARLQSMGPFVLMFIIFFFSRPLSYLTALVYYVLTGGADGYF